MLQVLQFQKIKIYLLSYDGALFHHLVQNKLRRNGMCSIVDLIVDVHYSVVIVDV